MPLLGPGSPARFQVDGQGLVAQADWQGSHVELRLVLADDAPAWFWHVSVRNATPRAADRGPDPRAGRRPRDLRRRAHERVLRQPVPGPCAAAQRAPGLDAGRAAEHGRRRPASLAADGCAAARRVVCHRCAAAARPGVARGRRARGTRRGLPGTRLQHEHAMAALQEQPVTLQPNESAQLGFFARFEGRPSRGERPAGPRARRRHARAAAGAPAAAIGVARRPCPGRFALHDGADARDDRPRRRRARRPVRPAPPRGA